MQIQRIQNNNYHTNFSGMGHRDLALAKKQEENVMSAIRKAAKKRHRDDRDTFVKEKWNNFLTERIVASSEHRGIDMKKVLKESSHDKEMNRCRNRR